MVSTACGTSSGEFLCLTKPAAIGVIHKLERVLTVKQPRCQQATEPSQLAAG
jgi:hypothetical protein